jgi:uncharacterized protein
MERADNVEETGHVQAAAHAGLSYEEAGAHTDRVLAVTDRTRLRRKRERGSHEREAIYSILDEGLICHVGFSDGGSLYVVPTTYARLGDQIYLHGAAANRTLAEAAAGAPVCVTVTLLDGLVFSRSAFHHSMNFRSVMVFGTATKVEDPQEKTRALLAIVDHVTPGRGADCRPPTRVELAATSVVRIELDEASAKVRTGGPLEEPEDLDLAVWGGELPLTIVAKEPVPDKLLPSGTELPLYVRDYLSSRRSALQLEEPVSEREAPSD